MTTGTLQERMMTISRYFTREKWKNETGVFQYPRGKRRTDAVVEALEIAFEPTEFELKKELNLRGDDVVASASEETEKVSENLEVLKKEVEDALKDSEPASETAIDTKEEPDVKKDSETGKTTEENFDIEDNEESSIEDELDVLEDELPLL